MAVSDEFAEEVCRRLADLGGVTARKMFGGYGLFLDGLMFGLIADDVLYFKVDDGNRAAYQEAGSRPFRFTRKDSNKPIEMSYWIVPGALFSDLPKLCDWAREAHAAAIRSKKPGRRE